WCRTQWPTAALAQEAGMSELDYEPSMGASLFLDRADPVAPWRALTGRQPRLVDELADVSDIHLEAKSTDLRLRVDGRIWINTNTGIDRPTGSILLDEKLAGTVHLALGRAYPETGGTNRSALHWDMICDLRRGGRISADGQMLNDKLWLVG